MKRNYLILIIILFIFNIESSAHANFKIKYKIQNEIITNIDINKEARYLIALNDQLNNLDKKKLINLAEKSIIKEKIKKITLQDIYNLDQRDPYLDDVIKNIYSRMNITNLEEFKERLKSLDLNYQFVKKKIEIEVRWNDLIYSRYNDKVKINKENFVKKINKLEDTEIKEYFISEILFEKKLENTVEQTYEKISESIKEIGFSNTANLYSIADSSKTGGKVGWVKENNLSKFLSEKLEKINIGEFTSPTQVGNNFLILKIDDIKTNKILINKDKELKNMIEFERNKQLSQFSQIFYNKVKSNIIIDG